MMSYYNRIGNLISNIRMKRKADFGFADYRVATAMAPGSSRLLRTKYSLVLRVRLNIAKTFWVFIKSTLFVGTNL